MPISGQPDVTFQPVGTVIESPEIRRQGVLSDGIARAAVRQYARKRPSHVPIVTRWCEATPKRTKTRHEMVRTKFSVDQRPPTCQDGVVPAFLGGDTMADQPGSPEEATVEEDELHRRFREALERKKSERHDSHGAGAQGRGVGPAVNDKRQRQFRRKSG
jgi:uncharacterized protein DUF5302